MKISELVSKLQEVQKVAGDINVWSAEQENYVAVGPVGFLRIMRTEELDMFNEKTDKGETVLLLMEDSVDGAEIPMETPDETYEACPWIIDLQNRGIIDNEPASLKYQSERDREYHRYANAKVTGIHHEPGKGTIWFENSVVVRQEWASPITVFVPGEKGFVEQPPEYLVGCQLVNILGTHKFNVAKQPDEDNTWPPSWNEVHGIGPVNVILGPV